MSHDLSHPIKIESETYRHSTPLRRCVYRENMTDTAIFLVEIIVPQNLPLTAFTSKQFFILIKILSSYDIWRCGGVVDENNNNLYSLSGFQLS